MKWLYNLIMHNIKMVFIPHEAIYIYYIMVLEKLNAPI